MLQSLIITGQSTLNETLSRINDNGLGIVFCVNAKDEFVGTFTDGDARRAILAGIPLDTPLLSIVDHQSKAYQKILDSCKSPEMISRLKQDSVFAWEHTPYAELIKKVNDRITIIPILNQQKRIVNYFEYRAHFNVPIANSILSHAEISNVLECLETNWISSQGKFVNLFEEKFNEYIGSKYSLCVMNCTVALHLALEVYGIGAGDEVIVPDLTFGATINSVLHAGATPVIVDVDKSTWCIDPDAMKQAITNKTKAVVPVHLYGMPCDMKEITSLAKEHNLIVIEDVAEALGGEYQGVKLGNIGQIGCYSFFGNKVITTGEGGMITTNDEAIYEKLKVLRDHGMSKTKRYWHEYPGFNYRMTNMQAAVGCGQLERIDSILAKREEILKVYQDFLDPEYFEHQQKHALGKNIVWLVSVLLNEKVDKDLFLAEIKNENIDIRPFFYPLSEMPIFAKYSVKDHSVTKNLSNRGINLPTLINLDLEDYRKICEKINTTVKRCLK